MTLTESPLPAIYVLNRLGIIQLFYFNDKEHTQLYILDERGALFQQRLQATEEHYLLVQQHRFINDICLMRTHSWKSRRAACCWMHLNSIA